MSFGNSAKEACLIKWACLNQWRCWQSTLCYLLCGTDEVDGPEEGEEMDYPADYDEQRLREILSGPSSRWVVKTVHWDLCSTVASSAVPQNQSECILTSLLTFLFNSLYTSVKITMLGGSSPLQSCYLMPFRFFMRCFAVFVQLAAVLSLLLCKGCETHQHQSVAMALLTRSHF